MNKRQRKKAFKKAMQRAFARMDDPQVMRELGDVASEFIRKQLARPSPLRDLGLFTPLLKPPFTRWRDDAGLVHLVGMIMGTRWHQVSTSVGKMTMEPFDTPEHFTACMARSVEPPFAPDDTVVTCVSCQAYESERAWLPR